LLPFSRATCRIGAIWLVQSAELLWIKWSLAQSNQVAIPRHRLANQFAVLVEKSGARPC
jgi:hypothetical protein